MKIFALTWRGIKLVAALLLAVIGILNVYVALTGREPATETTVQEQKENQGAIIVQENVVAGPDSLKVEENKSATVENPNSGPEYVASEINRIKNEANSLFVGLLETKEVIRLSAIVNIAGCDKTNETEAIKTYSYERYKRMRDSLSGLQEQLALLQRRTDYAELRDRKDSGHLILLGRYVEVKLAKAREVAKAQHEWLSFYAQHREDKDDGAKSKGNELLREWRALQDELSEILPSSIKEDPVDLYKKGLRYYNGDGVEKDYVYAFQCFQSAAEQEFADAQFKLGVMYAKGEGVSQDYVEAVKWSRMAAEQGDATAQYNLAWSYYNGKGVSQDYIEAAKWYRKAAEQGDADAQTKLGKMYAEGQGVSQDHTEAAKWARMAAEQGNATAQYNLAWCYYNGKGVSQDYTEAAKWYRKAAEQGDSDAQFWLGKMYTDGEGVAQDYAEAVKWHRKASEQGDETSKEVLPLLQARLAKTNQQQDGLDQAITALGEFADKAVGKVAEWLSSDSGSLTEEERKRRQKMDDDMMIYNTLVAPQINQAVGF